VRRADGFVAIEDVNPRADVHLLVLPERHVSSFREIAEFDASESKRMLDFVAETAREAGVDEETLDKALDYRAMAKPNLSRTETS